MTNLLQRISLFLTTNVRQAPALAIGLALTTVLTPPARSQTFQVIHTFTGTDGANPYTGLTSGPAGTFYGTTFLGGSSNHGSVFKLAPSGSSWVLTPLYDFAGGSDGACPWSRVIFGPDGSLYGATTAAAFPCSGSNGYGTVFKLRPPATACRTALCPWTQTILYAFGGDDGYVPTGDLTFDSAGNLYGTTRNGGQDGVGTVY
jgi:uncharacterized repeat protein (TIGR03803 family)